MTGDELRTEMRDGFKKVDDEFANVRTEVRNGFKKVDDEFANVRAEIKAEAETTRRHFDIVGESLSESIEMIAEAPRTTRRAWTTTKRG